MNNKICNPKTEVPTTKDMNDLDYITDVLETIKNMVHNYSLALNEASNNTLYEEYKNIFDETSTIQRDLFDLMFQKGWYCLEEADNQKITESLNKYNNQLDQLS